MDMVDQSFEEEQNYIKDNLSRVKAVKCIKLKPQGYCYNCFEDLEDNKIFCNKECAEQYEISQKFNR